jgi:hypothetical protein
MASTARASATGSPRPRYSNWPGTTRPLWHLSRSLSW